MAKRADKGVFIHPLAVVDPAVPIGKGTRVWQFTIIQKGTSIGRNCNIGAHCYIEWGTSIGHSVTVKNLVSLWEGLKVEDGVFIGPNAIFTNDIYPRSLRLAGAHKPIINETRLELGCAIGAGAMVLSRLSVGRFATIGMGSVVLEDVPPFALMAGNPARQIGFVCECGIVLERLKARRWECPQCAKGYEERRGLLLRVSSEAPASGRRKLAASSTSR
jgi:acetyltransferase-like isoleucine patch superfamily enzyme